MMNSNVIIAMLQTSAPAGQMPAASRLLLRILNCTPPANAQQRLGSPSLVDEAAQSHFPAFGNGGTGETSNSSDASGGATAGYAGLQNQGSTCYLNSWLQTLFHIKSFREVPNFTPSFARSHHPREPCLLWTAIMLLCYVSLEDCVLHTDGIQGWLVS